MAHGLALPPYSDVEVGWLDLNAQRLVLHDAHGAGTVEHHHKVLGAVRSGPNLLRRATEGSSALGVEVAVLSDEGYPVNLHRGFIVARGLPLASGERMTVPCVTLAQSAVLALRSSARFLKHDRSLWPCFLQ